MQNCMCSRPVPWKTVAFQLCWIMGMNWTASVRWRTSGCTQSSRECWTGVIRKNSIRASNPTQSSPNLHFYRSSSVRKRPWSLRLEPMVEMNLIKIRAHEFFPQLVRLAAHERFPQSGQVGDQELSDPVGINLRVGVGRLHLLNALVITRRRCGRSAMSRRRWMNAIRSTEQERTKSERPFRSTTQYIPVRRWSSLLV